MSPFKTLCEKPQALQQCGIAIKLNYRPVEEQRGFRKAYICGPQESFVKGADASQWRRDATDRRD